ncbi:5-methylcytosine-specific restriction enzyme subunit McrC [Oceanihabitans sediminis]|uniref:Restriction endonuclease n=1 Tax=Oceanihabitans sediminis TaxID=1812012 RepID=A0A368P241_9FLAO|nr:restriction endonuclease [Oceanihabitans sediminis]RBP28400.1 5-methylcytosine-specific restriction enzyme subunit McrC [Oceanihabitans sediminis]RCU56598.1 restriction endonuclease [Oceanihabitans sediminis]
MKKRGNISVFEHQRLYVGEQGFKQVHLDALLKLNEYHDGNYFEPIAKGIKFNQYVGVIQVDGLTIEIHPKADKDDEDRKWKGVLIKMLQACGKLKAESSGVAHVKRQHLNLLEVYFELYLFEIENLVRKGLIKQYRKQTRNTKALKGKLEFANHIRKNCVHKERFYTTHQVYDQDHFLHQVLYKALTVVEQFTKGSRLQDLTNRVLLNFPEVTNKTITAKQLNSIQLNRKSNAYSSALELARLIILNYSPDISSGKEKMLSLLFDMNVLWEEYILKQLQKACVGTGITVSGQESKSFWGNNSLRPDVVLREGETTYIIDTKWKRPNKTAASVGDLRQMYTYCRFWDAEKAMLLYPGTDSENKFKSYLTDDYSKDHEDNHREIDHQCKMGFVSVLGDNNNLNTNIGSLILDLIKL